MNALAFSKIPHFHDLLQSINFFNPSTQYLIDYG